MKTHEAAGAFDRMPDERYEELRDSIAEHGLSVPLVKLPDGRLLDGRHRLRACEEVGVEPRFEVYKGDDPYTQAALLNGMRRDLTKSQRAAAAAELFVMRESFFRAQARKAKGEAGRKSAPGRKAEKDAYKHAHLSREPATTAALGSKFGISRLPVEQAIKVKKADPDMFESVKRGDITVNKAASMVKAESNDQQQNSGRKVGTNCGSPEEIESNLLRLANGKPWGYDEASSALPPAKGGRPYPVRKVHSLLAVGALLPQFEIEKGPESFTVVIDKELGYYLRHGDKSLISIVRAAQRAKAALHEARGGARGQMPGAKEPILLVGIEKAIRILAEAVGQNGHIHHSGQ